MSRRFWEIWARLARQVMTPEERWPIVKRMAKLQPLLRKKRSRK